MKLTPWIEKLNRQGKIKNEELEKLLPTLPDVELPDVWVNLVEENFLTRERAAADFEIVKKIKAETLNGVDEKLKGVLPLLDATGKEEFEKEINTFKKVESVVNLIPKLLEKVKAENPSSDEAVKELKKSNQELVEKIKTINANAEKKEKELQDQFAQRETSMKVDWTLEKEVNKYTLADEFSGIKEAIIKNILTDVKGKNALALGENGQILVQEIVNGAPKQKFNGNDPVTIESLLAEPLKPFLKKNNANGNGQQPQTQAQTRPQTQHVANAQQNGLTIELPRAKPNTPNI